MVRDLADAPLMPANGERMFQLYGTICARFMNAARDAGIPAGVHAALFASRVRAAMLSKGVPVTDVTYWLGHRDVRVTFRIYGQLVPSAAAGARIFSLRPTPRHPVPKKHPNKDKQEIGTSQ